MTKYNIGLVPDFLIPVLWDELSPLLARSVNMSNGEATLASVYDRAMRGQSTIHVVTLDNEILLAFTLEVIEYESGKRSLLIPFISGEKLFAEYSDQFMDYMILACRTLKCEDIRGMSVRKGWMKILEKYNWEVVHQVIKCKVEP